MDPFPFAFFCSAKSAAQKIRSARISWVLILLAFAPLTTNAQYGLLPDSPESLQVEATKTLDVCVDKYLHFAISGKVLFTQCHEKFAAWDWMTGKRLWSYSAPDNLMRLAVSPNGEKVAAGVGNGDEKGTLILLDARTGTPTETLKKPGHYFNGIEFSPDSSRIVSVGGGEAYLWLLDSKTIVPLGERGVVNAGFSIDGAFAFTVQDENSFSVWDGRSGERAQLSQWTGRAGSDHESLGWAISADGSRFAQLAEDAPHATVIRDMRSRKELARISFECPHYPRMMFSRDATKLLLGCYDKGAVIFDTRTVKPLLTIRDNVDYASFTPDDSSLILSSEHDGKLRILKIDSSGDLSRLREALKNKASTADLPFADGETAEERFKLPWSLFQTR